jgi:hypothetical protein
MLEAYNQERKTMLPALVNLHVLYRNDITAMRKLTADTTCTEPLLNPLPRNEYTRNNRKIVGGVVLGAIRVPELVLFINTFSATKVMKNPVRYVANG